jgi:excisionase family DNA binding protein
MSQRKKSISAYCTTREAADILGISLRTAQLWVERGQLEAWKTDGGHRRISRSSVERLLHPQPRGEVNLPKMSGSAPISILVVEDDPHLLEMYQLQMQLWRCRPNVATATDGFSALVQMGLKTPDLLVTDLKMPGMNGFEMLQRLVQMPETSQTEIVVVTSLDSEEIAAQGGLPPGVKILKKPLDMAQVEHIALAIMAC